VIWIAEDFFSLKYIAMKQTLTNLFRNYGDVLDVVAHRNLRMRGQAFVSFAGPEIAAKAQKEVNRFPLYSKAMVSSASFPLRSS
jgi:RNA recognition motif-containing protein